MTKMELISKAVRSARYGRIDDVEAAFDILTTLEISDEDKYEVGCILANLCAIADGRDK